MPKLRQKIVSSIVNANSAGRESFPKVLFGLMNLQSEIICALPLPRHLERGLRNNTINTHKRKQ